VVGKGSRQKHAKLLEDPDLKRWYDNTSRGSRVTADVYLRRLGGFCVNREITQEEIIYEKIPTIVRVRKELSKAGHQYITFLGQEGCDHLQAYLEERARNEEKLGPGTAIITQKSGRKKFITRVCNALLGFPR